MTTTNAVISHTRAVPMIIVASQAAELPAPEEITISAEGVDISLETREDLEAWAEWIDVEISEVDPHPHVRHSYAAGEKFDLPLQIRHVGLKTGASL